MHIPPELVEHFARLGAPLADPERSTSAVRPGDGAVFLLVWADHKRKIGGGLYPFRLLVNLGSHGERRDHVGRLLDDSQAKGFLVVATAHDPEAKPSSLKSFNGGTVRPVGRVVVLDGQVYAECLPPIPCRDALCINMGCD